MKKVLIIMLLGFSISNIIAQPSWKSKESSSNVKLALFHSTQTANFPTTESLEKGNWMYEISHRFIPSVNEGIESLYGFDGPARIRFALAYGITDNLMITFGRSNNMDNYDLQVKQKVLEINSPHIPSVISILGGIAINTGIPRNINRDKFDPDNMQIYLQGIFNIMILDKKIGIGVVTSYLYNSFIYSVEKQYTLTIGAYIQYYFNRTWSVWLESNSIAAGYQGRIRLDETGKSYNSLAIGFTIETGGHIFNIMVTNNSRLNSSQFIVGADRGENNDAWRLGFGIIRYF